MLNKLRQLSFLIGLFFVSFCVMGRGYSLMADEMQLNTSGASGDEMIKPTIEKEGKDQSNPKATISIINKSTCFGISFLRKDFELYLHCGEKDAVWIPKSGASNPIEVKPGEYYIIYCDKSSRPSIGNAFHFSAKEGNHIEIYFNTTQAGISNTTCALGVIRNDRRAFHKILETSVYSCE